MTSFVRRLILRINLRGSRFTMPAAQSGQCGHRGFMMLMPADRAGGVFKISCWFFCLTLAAVRGSPGMCVSICFRGKCRSGGNENMGCCPKNG
ncbi:hypothetical protein BKA82DRAFT_792421 [Pisolithus tinctorius]|uniref:Uncharacterized protein n=1 Tax=Pisolithus tinctorius Marx 270 TaxID=870435 RepID=A0A0C3KPU2_PISTI|nr:hypothetical protein BKA82DRAFT_792421 [Pisolithus tinctorius]KIO11637.1 hypothetical protein M404DRAFT_792421 [Pisolithus tinctorius Marx 270]